MIGFTNLAVGQVPLDVIAGRSSSKQVAFAISFTGSPPICPEGHGALQISAEAIWFIQSPVSRGNANSTIGKPTDDETYQHRTATYDCLLDVTVRVHVLRDGQWTPLLVPRSMRPSLPPEERFSPQERREIERLSAALKERLRSGVRPSSDESNRWLNGPGNLPRLTRIFNQTKGMSAFYEFDGMPANCVQVVGEYWLDQNGIAFFFPTNFPDDFNRFAAEFYRFDDFRSRLVFVRGECRVEMTIGKAVLDHGLWLPIPIASIARSR
jgi:hypothetical protein